MFLCVYMMALCSTKIQQSHEELILDTKLLDVLVYKYILPGLRKPQSENSLLQDISDVLVTSLLLQIG